MIADKTPWASSSAAEPKSTIRARMEPANDPMWLVTLHAAACRRWLLGNPPRLEEVGSSLRKIEALSTQVVPTVEEK